MRSSLWSTTAETPKFGSLDRSQSFDVVVVGGGIAGLSTAMGLLDSGLKIAIIEARSLASLASGRTTAKLTPLHQATYRKLKGDPERAKVYAAANSYATDLVCKWVKDYNLDCDLRKVPAVSFATNSDDNAIIAEEFEAARQAGLSVDTYKATTSGLPITGGIIHKDSYSFHATKYFHSLAKVLSARGVKIFDNTRVDSVEEGCVTVGQYKLLTEKIVITTGAPITGRGLFFAKTYPKRSYIIGVKLASGDLPQENLISVGESYHSIRPVIEQDILLIGGEGHKVGQEGSSQKRIDSLIAYAKAHFDVAAIPYTWSNQDFVSHDEMPFIGPINQEMSMYVATGFGLWGMSHGTLAGYLISSQIQGNQIADWSKFYEPNRSSSLFNLQSIKQNIDSSAHLVLDHLKPKADFDDIAVGSGKVVKKDGETLAVYRESRDKLTLVSASCTHMGGVVQFNELEKRLGLPLSWDSL